MFAGKAAKADREEKPVKEKTAKVPKRRRCTSESASELTEPSDGGWSSPDDSSDDGTPAARGTACYFATDIGTSRRLCAHLHMLHTSC